MEKVIEENHPLDSFLSKQAFSTVWCSGCGIGIVVSSFMQAINELKIDKKKIVIISGNGCVGKVANYVDLESYSVRNSSIINYAVNLKNRNYNKKVIVFSNNADFLLSDEKDFLEAGRKNNEIIIIHINNFINNINEKGIFPISPFARISKKNICALPYNIPCLAESSNAVYCARWTPLRTGWLRYSVKDAFFKKGLSLIEVISPCLIYNTTKKNIGKVSEKIKFYLKNIKMENPENTKNLDIRGKNKIIIGKFIDK